MTKDDAPRASPEALLSEAEREGRGRLRLFLGAAPGVGKTFAMLQAARAALAARRDVVVGIVETHGRAETAALVEGLDVLPRKQIPYKGRLVSEFDVDAALERRPALLLVDEYAHSNVPGSRHPKRWQDVAELLGAGIDVWTTMNVQHVESLNDVVQRITGVRVRETVPDTTLTIADEIVLVDLPSDELIRRLAEGKVYVEDTATRATQNFFKPSNLTALRELALRQVASRVDSDLLERMQGGAIEGPWAAGERLLVCLGPDGTAERLVRAAKRLADLLDAPWFAVTVERPGTTPDDQAAARLDAAMRLARDLGAETATLVATDLAGELLRFARYENITQLVVGRALSRRLVRFSGRSGLADALVRRAGGIAVHVVTATGPAGVPARWSLPALGPLAAYPAAAAGVVAATLLGSALTRVVALPNVSMLFLLAVLVPAIVFGVWPAVFSSFLSFAAYNFFFIDPVYSFTVARPHELLALAVFLIISVTISALAGRAREQMRVAAGRTRAARRLYRFTRTLSALADGPQVAEAAASEINAALGRAAVILLPRGEDLAIAAAWPPDDRMDVPSRTAARWAFDRNEMAGAGTGTLPNSGWTFRPLHVPDRRVGVLGIEQSAERPALGLEEGTLLDALAEQTAAALHRTDLSLQVGQARAAAETERVRNILLASISHDFRTPLASVLGAASSLIDYADRIEPEARLDLLAQIRDEARHLDAMVRNLLSMTRLEAGALELNRDWIDMAEGLNRIVDAARRRGATQSFAIEVSPDLPLVYADQSLIDQAIGNIVANAMRHAGGGAHVRLKAEAGNGELRLTIRDDGPGVSAEVGPQVFEKFVRARSGNADGGQGAGLGLAITKGIVEAHGGTVELLTNEPGARGAAFRIRLPLDARVRP